MGVFPRLNKQIALLKGTVRIRKIGAINYRRYALVSQVLVSGHAFPVICGMLLVLPAVADGADTPRPLAPL